MIYWLLYLFCGLIIAGCMIVFGRTLTQDPDSGFSASIAYKNKLLTAHPELNAQVQKQYGTYLNKGGFGLAVIVIVGLLCVVSQSQDAIMIGGNIILVIELLYALGLQIWMNQYVQKLTGAKPTSSKKKNAAKSSHSDTPAQKHRDQAVVNSAPHQASPTSELAPEMESEQTPAQTTAAGTEQTEEVFAQKENEPAQEAEWTENSKSVETEQAFADQENEMGAKSADVLSAGIESAAVESAESPVFATETESAQEEEEDDDLVDPSMQALIQADLQTSVPEKEEETAPTEAELDEQARDEQIAQALQIANRTLAASMIQDASEQSAPIAKRAAVEEEEKAPVEEEASVEEDVREEIHTPGVKLVATKTSPLSSAPDPQRK